MCNVHMNFFFAGFKFWKVGNRKIYAVTQFKGKRRLRKQVYSDDDDDFEPPRKHGCRDSQAVLKEVIKIKRNLAGFFKLSVKMKAKLPPGLLKQLTDSFKCHICSRTPLRPPVIFALCWKQILRCQSCVDKWCRQSGAESATRSCPLCRSERAHAETCIMKGLDDFLSTISPLLEDEGDSSSSDEFPEVNL